MFSSSTYMVSLFFFFFLFFLVSKTDPFGIYLGIWFEEGSNFIFFPVASQVSQHYLLKALIFSPLI